MSDRWAAEAPVRALVFDVDGTLYNQRMVRMLMLRRLLLATVRSPRTGFRALRVLGAYRRAQEILRHDQSLTRACTREQLAVACAATGASPDDVRDCVRRWMDDEPLPLLQRQMYPGLPALLRRARFSGLRLGVASDYAAERKLEAMGLADCFDAIVCADDPDVGRFKPDPRGLLVVLERLGVPPCEALYIGDRPDVDAVAATRAGMRFVLMGAPSRHRGAYSGPFACDFTDVAGLVFDE
jgi:HAD superfamily hydrolase (TIGR01509 family)